MKGGQAFFGRFFVGRLTTYCKGHVNTNKVLIGGLVWLLFRFSTRMIINKKGKFQCLST